MKKHALLLIGFFVAIVVAVLFAACEKKESVNGGGGEGGGGGTTTTSKLIGSWKYVDTYDNMTIYVTFKADNTGVLKRSSSYYGTVTSQFYYSYDASQETVTMKIQDESYGYTDYETIKAGLTWYGNDRFFFRYLDYGYSGDDDYEIGPFVRQ